MQGGGGSARSGAEKEMKMGEFPILQYARLNIELVVDLVEFLLAMSYTSKQSIWYLTLFNA